MSFVFLFWFIIFYFGASSRSRAVKYSWLCCVLKIRLISTPSLFSSSASPLSLRSDEQQKHVYLALDCGFIRRQDLALVNSIGTPGGPAGVWWLLLRGHLHESRDLMKLHISKPHLRQSLDKAVSELNSPVGSIQNDVVPLPSVPLLLAESRLKKWKNNRICRSLLKKITREQKERKDVVDKQSSAYSHFRTKSWEVHV